MNEPGMRHWVALGAGVTAFVAGIVAIVTGDDRSAVAAGSAALLASVLVLWALEGPGGQEAAAPPSPPTSAPVDAIDVRDPAPVRSSSASPPVGPDPSAPGSIADRSVEESRGVDDAPAGPGPALLPQRYIEESLRGRVAVARRALRPVSVLYVEVVEIHPSGRNLPVPRAAIADAIASTLREADAAGDAGDHGFLCVLEDTGEDGAVWTAERLRRGLASEGSGRRFRAGVASYPTHGLDAAELQAKARAALVIARDWSRDRIEVAPAT